MKEKAAIYCRLSEEDKNKMLPTDDSSSIQNQKSMLLQYSLEHDWDVYGIYSDDDYTGSDRHRPAFRKLLEDASAHKFDIILCKTQSRFTRELELVEKYIHGLFPVWGIRFVSIVDNADTANKGNKKARQINGLVNEWYLEDMSENIKSVLTDRRRKGCHIGSFALYGYKKDPAQKGHLIIDEEAAKVVREIFTLFSKGYGKTAIARTLNDRGVPNPTEYKRLQGLRCSQSGSLWSYSAISHMLVNEMYIGNMVQGKYGSISYKTKQNRPRPKKSWYIVKGTHEAIIEKDLWEKVQTLIAQNSRPFKSGTIGLFAGKARCLNCGCTMCSSKVREKHYLQCSARKKAKTACSGAFISVDSLEKAVIRELCTLSEKYIDKQGLEKAAFFFHTLTVQKETIERDITAYEKKTGKLEKGFRQLYLDRVNGILSENEFSDLYQTFTSEKEHLKVLISSRKKQLNVIENQIKSGYNQENVIRQYINPQQLNREIIEKMIDCIAIGKKDPASKEIPVEIHWNF